jgi:hypothetical protein
MTSTRHQDRHFHKCPIKTYNVVLFYRLTICCLWSCFYIDRYSHGGGRGHDQMLYTTTCSISAYHYKSCEFESYSWQGVLDKTLCDQACQWLVAGQYFSTGTPVFSTNKSSRHDIAEILMIVVLDTTTLTCTFALGNLEGFLSQL